uniref:heavy metal-associated isoprenylated plant protein 3-like n=1 Tax=Erigeron canadensis TaxID=72917 RepID=UPI001CB8B7CC|nr:heavy metal-associated isoprenylated plant protein 3-like [Erigeron canadensis]
MAKMNQSNNNEKPPKGGDRKNNDDGTMTVVVLKIDLHCEGCAGKIAKVVRTLNGVESVKKGDNELKKIKVIGKVDPVELRQKVEEKIKKKVELISPVTKKQNDAGNGEQPPKEPKQQTATAKDKNKPKKFPVTTTVFKISLDCQGCIDNIQKLIRKTDGFIEMSIERKKDLVTVKGGIDVDKLVAALKDKLKKKVEIVRAKDGSEKKGKDGEGDGKGSGGGKKGKGGEGDGKESGEDPQVEQYQYFVSQSQYIYPQYVNVPEYPYGYMHPHAPSMFSDENPNAACVVM